MYSVVLVMAMTTGGDVADCHRHRHHGDCGGGAVASCSGGGYGGYSGGCSGSAYSGSCSGGYGGGAYSGSCSGGYYGSGMPSYGPGQRPGEPLKMPGDKKDDKKKPEDVKKPISGLTAPARIVVSLPADASLTIDDYTSPARSATQIVQSGPLGAEETCTYVLKAQALRDGKMQTTEQRVTVRGGEEKQVTLTLPTTVAAR